MAIPALDEDGGDLQIDIRGAAGAVHARTAFKRGVPMRVRIAVPVSDRLEVRASTASGLTLQAHQDFKSAERPVLAWVGSGLAATSAAPMHASLRIEALQPGDLPRIAASYSSIAGLVIDGDALSALDDTQLLALLEHVRRCGFVYLVRATPEARAVFTRAAGCGGRNLLLAADMPDAPRLANAFADSRIPSSPDSSRLASLASDNSRVAMLAAALLGYAILAILWLTYPVRSRWLLAAPLLAAGCVLVILLAIPGVESLVVWAEAGAPDTNARYSALLRVHGAVPGRQEVRLPPVLGNAGFSGAGPGSTLQWDADNARLVGARLRTVLLTEARLQFQGSFPLAATASVSMTGANRLTVHNERSAALDKGWLLYRGRQYAVAHVPPHGQVTVEIANGIEPTESAQRLAAERLAFDEAGVLLALDLAGMRDKNSPRSADGWLLIRQGLSQAQL